MQLFSIFVKEIEARGNLNLHCVCTCHAMFMSQFLQNVNVFWVTPYSQKTRWLASGHSCLTASPTASLQRFSIFCWPQPAPIQHEGSSAGCPGQPGAWTTPAQGLSTWERVGQHPTCPTHRMERLVQRWIWRTEPLQQLRLLQQLQPLQQLRSLHPWAEQATILAIRCEQRAWLCWRSSCPRHWTQSAGLFTWSRGFKRRHWRSTNNQQR